MPELPEVETVRATLEPVLTGRTITHIEIALPRLIKNATVEAFSKALSGCTFTAVGRKGKYLRLCTDGASDLLVHLRMTGSLIYDAAGDNRPKTAHIVCGLQSRVRRRAFPAMTTSVPMPIRRRLRLIICVKK